MTLPHIVTEYDICQLRAKSQILGDTETAWLCSLALNGDDLAMAQCECLVLAAIAEATDLTYDVLEGL